MAVVGKRIAAIEDTVEIEAASVTEAEIETALLADNEVVAEEQTDVENLIADEIEVDGTLMHHIEAVVVIVGFAGSDGFASVAYPPASFDTDKKFVVFVLASDFG